MPSGRKGTHTMEPKWCSLVIYISALLLGGLSTARGGGPLPKFTFQQVAMHPNDLNYAPTGDLIHPTIIKTEARAIGNPITWPPMLRRQIAVPF